LPPAPFWPSVLLFPGIAYQKEFRQVSLEPVDHPAACRGLRRPEDPLRRARAVLDQPDRGGERGAVHDLDQSPDPDRVPPTEGELEHPLPEVGEAVHPRSAAGEHHPGPQVFLVARRRISFRRRVKISSARGSDDLAEVLPADRAGKPPAHPGSSTSSSRRTFWIIAHPEETFRISASELGSFNPIAMSEVMLLPPRGRT